MIIECLIKSKCSFALAAFRSKVRSNIQFIKWQSLNNCRHDCTQSYDFMYQFQWYAVRLFLLLPWRPFIVSIKSLFANIHNWNIFPLLGKNSCLRIQWESFGWGRLQVSMNENCLHKYLYLFAHLQFLHEFRWLWIKKENKPVKRHARG